jgi:hypothetical protein
VGFIVPAPQTGVVALTAVDTADVFPALSTAATVYVYSVDAATPVSLVDVAGVSTCFTNAPSRYTLYPSSPDPPASADEFQLRLTWLHVATTAVSPVGVVGGVVSEHVCVLMLYVALFADSLPALSTADTA